MTDPPRRRNER